MLRERKIGLDILRSVAILLIVFGNTHFLFEPILGTSAIFFIFKHLGYDLFFTLSGFLIGAYISDEFNKDNLGMKSMFSFWKHRMLKILPNYLLFLGISILLVQQIQHGAAAPNNLVNFLTFTQNFSSPQGSFFIESWSISIVFWFYVLFPLSLVVLQSIMPHRFNKKSILILCASIFIIIPLLLRIFNTNFEGIDWNTGIRKVLIYRFDAFFVGVLLAVFKNYYRRSFFKSQNLLLGIGASLIFITLVTFKLLVLDNEDDTPNFFARVLFFDLTNIGFAFFIPFFYFIKPIRIKKFARRFFSLTSASSYAMYFAHSVVSIKLLHMFDLRSTLFILIAFVGYLIFTYGVAYLIYRFFEKPMSKISR